MVYDILLLIGALGFLAQLVLGFSHGGSHHGNNDAGHSVGHNGHTIANDGAHHVGHHTPLNHHTSGHVHHGHDGHGEVHGEHHEGPNAAKNGEKAQGGGLAWMSILSPLALFSIALGAGATGMLLRSIILVPLLLALAAAIGGFVFYGLIVQPLMRTILRFASKPAKNLGGVVAREVEVLGRFDEAGRGMVRAEVDGQVVRLLAYLDPDMRKDGMTVIPGERLVVTQVDPQKNTVRVTRL